MWSNHNWHATHGHWPPARRVLQWRRAQSRPKGAPPPQHGTNALASIFPPSALDAQWHFQIWPIKRGVKSNVGNGMACTDKGHHVWAEQTCMGCTAQNQPHVWLCGQFKRGVACTLEPHHLQSRLKAALDVPNTTMHQLHAWWAHVFGLDPKTDAHKPANHCMPTPQKNPPVKNQIN